MISIIFINRKQYITVNGYAFVKSIITHGVPQSSNACIFSAYHINKKLRNINRWL